MTINLSKEKQVNTFESRLFTKEMHATTKLEVRTIKND